MGQLTDVPQVVAQIENEFGVEAKEKRTGSGIQIDMDTLLARDGRTFIFVDYLFDSDNLYGVTGTRMVPVTEEEVDRRMEQLHDPEWSHLHHIYQEQVENGLDESWSSWIDRQIDLEGGIKLVLDFSYAGKYGETVKDKEESETGERPAYVECTGGGRMFDSDMQESDFDVVYDKALFELVKQVEATGLGVSEDE